MSSKDEAGFYRGTRRYLALLVAASPLFAFSKFVQGKLALDWRRWLTDHLLSSYFSNRAYFALKMGVHFEPGNKAGNSKDPLEAKGGCQGEEQGGCIDNPVSMVSTTLSSKPRREQVTRRFNLALDTCICLRHVDDAIGSSVEPTRNFGTVSQITSRVSLIQGNQYARSYRMYDWWDHDFPIPIARHTAAGFCIRSFPAPH